MVYAILKEGKKKKKEENISEHALRKDFWQLNFYSLHLQRATLSTELD